MATKTGFVCASCGHEAGRWFGRCGECGAWNSAAESIEHTRAVEIASLTTNSHPDRRFSTGISELDRALGGGVMTGSVNLLAGEPGIGKSTLLLQLLGSIRDRKGLLVTAEESLDQVAGRASRLGLGDIRALASARLSEVLAASARERPAVLVVDSVQAISDPAFDQPAGSIVQVRECTAALARHGKQTGTAMFLVGHVTKDGNVAGPKTLEHLVDSVLNLEGDRSGSLRLLRCMKNRFGSCEETGVFQMDKKGLESVPDPSAMMLSDRAAGADGSVVFCGMQGTRPFLVEVQALVVKNESNVPSRRVAIGFDSRRLPLLLAVLQKHLELNVGDSDVFVASAGGLPIREPAADLALCLSVYSGKLGFPVDPSLVAIGEVGLGGELRRVPNLRRRLSEAARLGFKRALVPSGSDIGDIEIEIDEARDLRSAFDLAATTARDSAA